MKVLKPLMLLLLMFPLPAQAQENPKAIPAATNLPGQPSKLALDALTPDELMARVLARNPALLAAQENVAAAQAEQKANEAMLWPMVSVNGQYTAGTNERMSMPVPGVEPGNMSMRPGGLSGHVNLTALYPLFTGGKFQAQIEAAKRRIEQMEAEYTGLKLELQAQTRQALLAVSWQMARADLLESEITRQYADLELAQQKLDLGKIPRYMVLRTQSEVARLQQELNLAHLEMHHQLTELSRLAALPQAHSLTQITGLPPLVLPLSLPVLPAMAESQRLASERAPRLKALRAQLAEAETRVDIARAQYYPFIYLAGNLDLGAGIGQAMAALQHAQAADPGAANGASVDLLIALPVFDGWKRDAERERLEHEASSLLNTYTDAHNRLQADVTRVMLEMETLRNNLELSAQLVEQFGEETRIAKLRFDSGKAIQLELLDAFNQWRSARLSQLENWFAYQKALIRFEQLLALPDPFSQAAQTGSTITR